MRRIMLAIFVMATALAAASLVSGDTQATPLQLAASNQQSLCFKKCLDQYGEDKKAACAMECGLVRSPNMNTPTRDCGTIYKNCMRGCSKDKACQKQCRAARRSCF
ncbi:MAG: hypothetical protein ISR47_07305 [Rhodospirillales bacterium]|nr:hypothetical protein [Rhodospirillales bacterium]